MSQIHSHSNHGDPLVREFMDKILEDVGDEQLYKSFIDGV